ncbi:MAG: flippase-like domain-containing protein [Clostridia bacterium]|nr:MAG: flippase-like domain-containing protein [Clostridia bacterium]
MAVELVGKQRLWLAVTVSLSAASIAAVFAATAGEGGWQMLAGMRPVYLLASIGFVLLLWIMEGLRLQVCLQIIGGKIRLLDALEVHLASSFAANITPFSSGGPPVATYFLCRKGLPLDQSLTLVTMRLLLTFAFFIITVPLILIFFNSMMGFTWWLQVLVMAIVIFILGLIAIFFYLLLHPASIRHLVRWAVNLRPVKRFLPDPNGSSLKAYRQLLVFSNTLALLFRGDRWKLGLVLLYTMLIWITFFAIGPVLLYGLGLNIPVTLTVARQIVLYFVISYIPLPGGSGVAELGMASLFASAVPKGLLATFVAGWRILTYHSGILAGAPVLLRLARRAPVRVSQPG